jgi:DNA-directed RNA polymerase specialized sigma54-like protein
MAEETDDREPWGGSLRGLLQDMTEDAILMLAEAKPEPCDVAAIEKRLRAIGVAARSVRAVQALNVRATANEDQAEDTMGGQHDDGLDAEDTEVLRARLQARIDRTRAVVEWKRNGRPEPGPDYRRSEAAQAAA